MVIRDKTKQADSPAASLPGKQFVNEKRLAAISGMSVYFFQKDRWLHKGLAPGCPYKKFGKSVRYELGAALAWFENSNDSTADLQAEAS